MITFKQYVLESAERYTPIKGDLDAILDTLKKYCSASMWMVENDTPLWRGINFHHDDAEIVDPTTSERKSVKLPNHYTTLLDNSPFMKDYPKRSRSLIAGTTIEIAKSYGDPYAIIPFDGVKIGVVNNTDIWNIKVSVFGGKIFFDSLARRLSYLCGSDLSELERFDSVLKSGNKNSILKFTEEFPGATEEQRNNFLDTLYDALRPEKVGFELLTSTENLKKLNSEIWIGGKCVMVPLHKWDSLVQKVKTDVEEI